MTTKPTFTAEELSEFDRASWRASSPDQVNRISGRMELRKLVARHGKEKCDAMFAFLTKKDRR